IARPMTTAEALTWGVELLPPPPAPVKLMPPPAPEKPFLNRIPQLGHLSSIGLIGPLPSSVLQPLQRHSCIVSKEGRLGIAGCCGITGCWGITGCCGITGCWGITGWRGMLGPGLKPGRRTPGWPCTAAGVKKQTAASGTSNAPNNQTRRFATGVLIGWVLRRGRLGRKASGAIAAGPGWEYSLTTGRPGGKPLDFFSP